MKDFYKILGVKENASEEEIRARWIELTKHYHPDRGEDMASDEKIREINEAYEVLKHSSTRVEYDLEKTYGQKKREGKRESYFKKLGVPASILVIFIIVGVLYLKNSQNEISQKNQINQIDQRNEPNQINQTNSTNEINQRNQTDPTISTNITIQTNPIPPATQKPFVASTPKPIASSTQQTPRRIDVLTPQPQVALATPVVPFEPNPTNQRSQTNPTSITIQTNPTDAINPIDAKGSTTQRPTDPTISTNITIQTSPTNPIDPKIEFAQFKPPSFLATEDEVRKFFNHYIERYHRMDIEGFLSLFSLKAVQNQKDGLEGIRKIYADFFNQGQEVLYNLQDMKIEIYQNAIEVRARYEINQVLKKGGEKKTWRGFVRWILSKENGALKIISLDYQHQKTP